MFLRKGCVLALVAFSLFASAREHTLSTKELREQLSGATISDGTHWSYTLHPDGRLGAIDMGKVRSGLWRISAGELCIRVPLNAEEDCWRIRQQGKQLFLVRDGGSPIAISVETTAGSR